MRHGTAPQSTEGEAGGASRSESLSQKRRSAIHSFLATLLRTVAGTSGNA